MKCRFCDEEAVYMICSEKDGDETFCLEHEPLAAKLVREALQNSPELIERFNTELENHGKSKGPGST